MSLYRPNIASGCMIIYHITKLMPLFLEILEIPNVQAAMNDLLKQHDTFYNQTIGEKPGEDNEFNDDEDRYTKTWSIKGKEGYLSVLFDLQEGYLFFHLHHQDIKKYELANQIIKMAEVRNRLKQAYNYEHALTLSKEQNKPVLIYFSEETCTECLQTELSVWTMEQKFKLLNEKFIVLTLNTDEVASHNLNNVHYYSDMLKRGTEKRGDIYKELQLKLLNTETMPCYAILNSEGKPLLPPLTRNPDSYDFEMFLRQGWRKYVDQAEPTT